MYMQVDQGADFIATIPLIDDNGLIIELTDFEVFAQFRKHYTSKIGYNINIEIQDPIGGIIGFTIPASQTMNIKAGRYVYDIIITNGENTFRVVEGILEINPAVTRP